MGEGAGVQLRLLLAAADDEKPLVEGVGGGIRGRALMIERFV